MALRRSSTRDNHTQSVGEAQANPPSAGALPPRSLLKRLQALAHLARARSRTTERLQCEQDASASLSACAVPLIAGAQRTSLLARRMRRSSSSVVNTTRNAQAPTTSPRPRHGTVTGAVTASSASRAPAPHTLRRSGKQRRRTQAVLAACGATAAAGGAGGGRALTAAPRSARCPKGTRAYVSSSPQGAPRQPLHHGAARAKASSGLPGEVSCTCKQRCVGKCSQAARSTGEQEGSWTGDPGQRAAHCWSPHLLGLRSLAGSSDQARHVRILLRSTAALAQAGQGKGAHHMAGRCSTASSAQRP